MFKKDSSKTSSKDHKDKKDKKSKASKDSRRDSQSEEEPQSPPAKSTPTSPPPAETQPQAVTQQPTPAPAQPKVDEEAEKKRREEEKKKQEAEKKAAEEKKEKERKEKEAKKPEDTKKSDSKKGETSERPSENIDAEIQSLNSTKLDPSEPATIYKDLYNLLPKEVFVAYDKLQNFARELNTQIPTPEIVIIGKKGHGKSSIIESFFGEALNAVGYDGVTQRPLYINVINNLACNTPKYTLKRDSLLKEFDRDVEVSLSDLPNEIAKRNKTASDEPIVLQYESKNVCNMTFIDTPALLDQDEVRVTKDERESLVLNLARPTHRLILCTEMCKDWSKLEMFNFVKKIDPELSRTTFVYTNFYTHVQSFTSTREVNKFLSGTLPDVKTFFTTMPILGVRNKFNEPEKYQEKIYQSYKRDMQTLEQLQYDKRYESYIGIHNLRKYVLNVAWKSYQESIPRILKHLRAKKVETEKQIKQLNAQLDSLDSSKLRSLASNYVVNFLQIVEKLISGTSEGNPSVNGQTLEEEKLAHGDGEWVDLYNRVIRFEPEEWNIPYWDNKLYGGQQFERLLAEYKSVSVHTLMSDVAPDDVATAAGINKLNNIPNYAWAASDLAQQKAQDAFVPLIEQLTSRAVYIMKRLTDISEKVLESRKKKWNEDLHTVASNNVDDIDRYPYFTYHVKDLFNKFVESTAKQCKEKCLDEFYSTRTIYWDLTSEFSNRNLPLERNDQEDTKKQVINLSTELFNELRDRITRNVMLKFYNFFLVPM